MPDGAIPVQHMRTIQVWPARNPRWQKQSGWRFGFSRFGGQGGSFSDVQYRTKAIVWR